MLIVCYYVLTERAAEGSVSGLSQTGFRPCASHICSSNCFKRTNFSGQRKHSRRTVGAIASMEDKKVDRLLDARTGTVYSLTWDTHNKRKQTYRCHFCRQMPRGSVNTGIAASETSTRAYLQSSGDVQQLCDARCGLTMMKRRWKMDKRLRGDLVLMTEYLQKILAWQRAAPALTISRKTSHHH
jgi:hypothetical protein